jgi:hypothetical protein
VAANLAGRSSHLGADQPTAYDDYSLSRLQSISKLYRLVQGPQVDDPRGIGSGLR